MQTSRFLRAGVFALIVATTACGGREGEEAGQQDAAQAPSRRDAPEPRSRLDPAPKAPAPAPAPDAAAGTESQKALRFDMTQDGEAQTAETFEAWMDEKGVRVAEGAEADVGSDKPAAGSGTSVTAEQRKAMETGND